MPVLEIRDRRRLHRFFKRNPALHIYETGDLDDFYWPQTVWFGLERRGELAAVALLYTGCSMPTLLALSDLGPPMMELLSSLAPRLPERFYAHLSPGVGAPLRKTHRLVPHGAHRKMRLAHPERLDTLETSSVVRLKPRDKDALLAFYAECYPGNWFAPRMLETRRYFGLKEKGRLMSVAGVHVCSPRYGVAALGNIATRPEARGRGLGTRVTARLCRSLLEDIPEIGLNVKSDNAAAVAVYEKLGFEHAATYLEYVLEKR